jgi:acyl-CoA synthetase (AMP-forming)/AMP-acid ligase II
VRQRALPAALKADVLARWPGDLFEYYGMTEGGGVCVLDARKRPDKLHTVGHPVPGSDMRVIDDDGRELPRGEAGEIVGRSPTMMTGYHKLPEKTAEVEWFDAQGQRFIRKRRRRPVRRGRLPDPARPQEGHDHLRWIEHLPERHRVDIARTRRRFRGRGGRRRLVTMGRNACGLRRPRPGTAVSAAALLAWTNERVDKAQRLAAVELVESLPRSDIGKILKRALRDVWLAKGKPLF